MNWRLVLRLLGFLAFLIGTAMLLSLPWSHPACGQTATFERAAFQGMLLSICICVTCGTVLMFCGRNPTGTVLRKEALAVVGLGWILCGALGGLPFLLTPTYRLPAVPMSVIDSVFESVSGFTTTGASVLTQLEVPEGVVDCEAAASRGEIAYIPRSVLFWRSFTHWLGGMGIIVLFVAVLGQLGAGGKALMRREVPGPLTDSVRPRIRETATLMWSIYLGLSLAMTVILAVQGLSVYDALCHTFGTLATGGFSTRNASVGAFQSAGIECVLILFMILAGINFNLYYVLLRKSARRVAPQRFQRVRSFLSDRELQTYLLIVVLAGVTLTVTLLMNQTYTSVTTGLRHAFFNVVTILTTTGFGTEDFTRWPQFAQSLLLALMFVGGCSGSTGGGIKVIRFIILAKVLHLEVERAFRPNLVRPLRLAGHRIDDQMGRDVLVYFCMIAVIFLGSWMLLVLIEPTTQWRTTGVGGSGQLIDCAAAVAATLNNIGPGVGVCGPSGNYTEFAQPSKALLTALMLLGRLELFAVIALLVPRFWKTG